MIRVNGFEHIDKISTGPNTTLYSAVRKADQRPVRLRGLDHLSSNEQAVLQLRHEYEIAQKNDLQGVLEVVDFVHGRDYCFLVEEDTKGIGLDRYLQEHPIREMRVFLLLAINMVKSLLLLHKAQIIHKDIQPASFIVDPESLAIKLTGLAYSSELRSETQEVKPPEQIEGTLAYMAPEQTGRMNKKIDYRSDFYALGVTFYEMLASKKPFDSKDPLELVHAHLAGKVPELSNYYFDVPAPLSAVIHKLMAKNPFERYQSAIGLLHDLEICLDSVEKTGTIDPFVLGKGDIVESLNLSQELYGREKEKQALLEAYERVSQGAVEGLIVGGYSGVGKTSLINEVHKPMVRDNGYFCSGKFDLLQRNIPYVAFRQALKHLARTILSSDEQSFLRVKEALLDALGNVAQLIIDICPDFEPILGAQPPLEKLPPQETQNRLQRYFRAFIRALADPEHPLIIFLDDLQWADSGSLQLIEYILSDEELSHVMLIGAYRDNEVHDTHPLSLLLQEFSKERSRLTILTLSPLAERDFVAFCADSFNRDASTLHPLAQTIHERTAGNPFFFKQVIRTLYKDKLLFFDRKEHLWNWDLKGIARYKIPDDVVGLILRKVKTLAAATTELLKRASCIGNQFDLATLEAISDLSGQEIRETIWIALKRELVASTDLSYKYSGAPASSPTDETRGANLQFQFLHDRIREAIYKITSPEERRQHHLAIAEYLVHHFPDAYKKERLFDVTDHFNQAKEIIGAEQEAELIDLNYRCARSAFRSNAYDNMVTYCESALSLADEAWWEDHYDTDFEINRLYAESLFLTNRRDECNQLTEALLLKARSKYDKASILRLQCKHLQIEGEYDKALKVAIDAIGLLGVSLPYQPSRFQVNMRLLYVHASLAAIGFDQLNERLTAVQDRNIRAVFEILSEIIYVIYWVKGHVLSYVAVETVRLALKYGYPSSISIWLTLYALTSYKFFRNTDTTFKIWMEAERFIQRVDNSYVAGICYEQRAKFLNHLKYPFAEAQPYYRKGLQLSRESGNLMAETLNMLNIATNYCYEERPIAESNAAYRGVLAHIADSKDKHLKHNLEFKIALYSNYAELKADSEKQVISSYQRMVGSNPNPFFAAVMNQYIAHYYFFKGDYETALAYHEQWFQAEKGLRYICDTIITKAHYALVIYKILPKRNLWDRLKLRRRLSRLHRDVAAMASESPENYRHFALLLDALAALDRQKSMRAIELFDQAISAAKNSKLLLSVALINELAGEAFYSTHNPRFYRDYIQEAYIYYERYGMSLRMQAMEEKYPELVQLASHTNEEEQSVSTAQSSAALDFRSLIKASQAISVEISAEKLFQTMLHVVLENAGATRALFFEREEDDTWTVTAGVKQNDQQQHFMMLQEPLNKYQDLPKTLVNYSVRSKEIYVFNSDMPQNQYDYDRYLVERGVKSALCLPVVSQNDMLGLIYVESDLISEAFTDDRITALQTLASQIAISLNNSRQMAELERHHKSTQRFVPKQLLRLLSKQSAEDIHLGDSMSHTITVMFNDIRNFTTHLEHRNPEDAFGFVNRYWTFMAPVIRKHSGYIDSFQGDAIMAIFPVSPDGATGAGKEMLAALQEFNEQQRQLGEGQVDIGIGINTGSAMLGIIGEEERLGTGVISDVVNTASRIESLNKVYKTQFLLSEQSYQQLQQPDTHDYRKIDKVVLKGKEKTTYLYELIDWSDVLRNISLSDYLLFFKAAFTAYEQGDFVEAKAKLTQCLSHYKGDGVAELLLSRSEHYLAHGRPDDWDGTTKLKNK